jgi:hypothetical protein
MRRLRRNGLVHYYRYIQVFWHCQKQDRSQSIPRHAQLGWNCPAVETLFRGERGACLSFFPSCFKYLGLRLEIQQEGLHEVCVFILPYHCINSLFGLS